MQQVGGGLYYRHEYHDGKIPGISVNTDSVTANHSHRNLRGEDLLGYGIPDLILLSSSLKADIKQFKAISKSSSSLEEQFACNAAREQDKLVLKIVKKILEKKVKGSLSEEAFSSSEENGYRGMPSNNAFDNRNINYNMPRPNGSGLRENRHPVPPHDAYQAYERPPQVTGLPAYQYGYQAYPYDHPGYPYGNLPNNYGHIGHPAAQAPQIEGMQARNQVSPYVEQIAEHSPPHSGYQAAAHGHGHINLSDIPVYTHGSFAPSPAEAAFCPPPEYQELIHDDLNRRLDSDFHAAQQAGGSNYEQSFTEYSRYQASAHTPSLRRPSEYPSHYNQSHEEPESS